MTKMRKLLAILLAGCMVIGIFSAALAETTQGTIGVESLPGGGKEDIDVLITVSKDGNKIETETTTPAGGDKTDSGLNVNYSSSSSGIIGEDGDPVITESESSYSVSNDLGTYGASGGSTFDTEVKTPTGTVDVPLTEGGKDGFTSGAPSGTQVPDGSNTGGTYNQTTTTTVQQGSVNVTTGKVEYTETTGGNEDMEYTFSDTTPNADNDLSSDSKYSPEYPADNVTVTDGYGYVYIGMGNHSQYWSASLRTSPSEDYPDEPPIVINGKNYYTGRDQSKLQANNQIERVYQDGKLYEVGKEFAIWDNVTQYVLIDVETGEYITTYCADLETAASRGYSYNMKNIEDATYYNEEQAAMIRTVAKNGYWGVEDDPGTAEAEPGSLKAIEEMMRNAVDKDGNPIFTEEDIASLTDGVALTATQFAIWTYSNAMDGVEFVGTHFLKKDGNNVSKFGSVGDLPEGKEDEADLLFKLYHYIISLDPIGIDEKDSSNTVYSKDNFLSDLSVTVLGKDETHANNQDADDTNDAYVTNLTFALVVTPKAGNEDELYVTVIDPNDGNRVIAQARIGAKGEEAAEGVLVPDGEDNYTFSGITLTEGNQTFKITLDGVQNLDSGVYLYTSEIKNDESSQSMVGIASGKQDVNVTMQISFDLSVNDEIITTEHVWRTEWNIPTPPPPGEEIPPNDPPLSPPPGEEIPDEDVPLAGLPNTGDASRTGLYLAIAAGVLLMLLAITAKSRKSEN